jgi:hypothetical protein
LVKKKIINNKKVHPRGCWLHPRGCKGGGEYYYLNLFFYPSVQIWEN